MYELLHHTPEISQYLQPLKPDDYYDGLNILELKLAPCSPEQILERRKAVHDATIAKIHHYGLEKNLLDNQDVFAPHINISVWDKDGNLMDSNHPAFDTTMRIR